MGKARIVIIGTGLGGCVLADRLLAAGLNVTMVTEAADGPGLVEDRGVPINLGIHTGRGLGGTTRYWHNGLTLPEDTVWPLGPLRREELAPFLDEALGCLSDASRAEVDALTRQAKEAHVAAGIPPHLLGQSLFYPLTRRNVWNSLRLQERVTLVRGQCLPPEAPENNVLEQVKVQTEAGTRTVTGDIFIFAAGGLVTPGLLEAFSGRAGFGYEDHPTGFIAEIRLNSALYKLWNLRAPHLGAGMRLPLRMDMPDGPIAFYLRPAYHKVSEGKKAKVTSVINNLRNEPWNLKHYMALLGRMDDMFDILSLKFGLNVKTDLFNLMFVAAQPASRHKAVGRNPDGGVWRDWRLDESYLDDIEHAVRRLANELGSMVKGFRIFEGWRETLTSSSHHSGGARMAKSPKEGMCDVDGKVFGTANVYVADGSLIPASGYANTGWLIAALARRLGHKLAREIAPAKNRDVDVVVTGAGGLAGTALVPLLKQAGLKVETLAVFERHGGKARRILHLANIHAQPAANLRLMEDVRRRVEGRVDAWLVPMSFSTLHGFGKLDAGAFNAGKRPWILSIYPLGKLLQEQRLMAWVARGIVKSVHLFYLPAIAIEGGPTARLVAQAKRHGYVLPWPMPRNARANMLELEKLAGWLVTDIRREAPPGLRRAVLSSRKSQRLTWDKYLGGNVVKAPPRSLRNRLNGWRDGVQGLILAALYWSGAFLPVWLRLKGERFPPRSTARSDALVPATPVVFDGSGAIIMRLQPFMATEAL